MRSNRFGYLALGFYVLLAATPVEAHHAYMGKYDLKTPMTLQGVITKVDWVNPHISFNIDVKDKSGKVTNWTVESANPGALIGRGWTRDSLKFGEQVIVEGYPGKKGEPFAAARTVTLSDGRKLSANSDGVPR